MIAEFVNAIKIGVQASKSMGNRGQGGVGVIAAVMIGLAVSIFLTVTLFNSLNLNTGLYSTVLTVLLPILVFAAVVGFVIKFLG